MCYGCWEEMKFPKIVNERTLRGADLVRQLYEFSVTCGNLHIVTDDWNIDKHHVVWCEKVIDGPPAEFRDDNPQQLAIEKQICVLFKAMTKKERASTLATAQDMFESHVA